MLWTHRSVYDALVNRRNFVKPGNKDVYVSLDHHRSGELVMVLYRPDSEYYAKSPLHVNRGRLGFSEDLFQKITPAIEKTSRGEPKWVKFKVIDWEKLAEALDLT